MIRVTTHGEGVGFDITGRIEGLSWSSVRPGGDERASFVFKSSWFAANPEIAEGLVLRISDGLRCLWQGRIEEHDRGGDRSEQIAVTAYGLGARLKDGQLNEVYIDKDLASWSGMPSARRSVLLGFSRRISDAGGVDQGGIIRTELVGAIGGYTHSEMWHRAVALIKAVDYQFTAGSTVNPATTNWYWAVYGSNDDAATSGALNTGNLRAASGSGTMTFSSAKRYVHLQHTYDVAGGTDGINYPVSWRVALRGDHGLTVRGVAPNHGFYDSDIVEDIISRVDGIQLREIEAGSYIVEQMIADGVTHEQAIMDAARFEDRVWGTWGPDSPLDTSLDGYFDYKLADRTERTWTVRRADCDGSPDLHSETSTLYDTVQVHYTDTAGRPQMVTRTRPVPDLESAGMSPRVARLDAGVMTTAGAETLGDAFLVLSGGFAPARGTLTISGKATHHQLGKIDAHHMRADGANLAIPDILPSTSLMGLDDTADRRTTFPIKRIQVDAAGPVPKTTVELDQTNDVLSLLQARLTAGADRVLAG